MRNVRLLWRCIRCQNRIFWRTPIGAFFTLVFPVLMLVLFTAIFGNDAFDTVYGRVTTTQFYTPGLAVFAAATSTYTGIAIGLTSRRELGILKRVRGTPATFDLPSRRSTISGVDSDTRGFNDGGSGSDGLRCEYRVGQGSGDAADLRGRVDDYVRTRCGDSIHSK